MGHTFRPVAEQLEILMRGVDCGDERTRRHMESELRARLTECQAQGRGLRVYCGFDPSSSELHLGHTIPLRKLQQFQELGHEAVFLIGTFTGTIGDPSDKEAAREQQSLETAMRKAESFSRQAFRILDRERTTVDYNHRWLKDLVFGELIEVASLFTLQQFLARQNFRLRHERGDAIWLHEFFYALMQAYDAYSLKTDVQIGGTDQLFNLMAGRKLMEARGMKPQTVLTYPILPGTDGLMRMSKSAGNTINIDDAPGLMYTKVLNLPDSVIPLYCDLLTRWDAERLRAAHDRIETDAATVKQELAAETVSIFHGAEQAEQAARDAARMHQGAAPSDTPRFVLTQAMTLLDVMVDADLVKSRGEGRRLVKQRAVKVDGATIEDIMLELAVPAGHSKVLQVGKRRFLEVVGS